MVAISSVHPQVGDGEGNGADAAAVAPTLSSTQKATSHLSRKGPFSLVSAACFCCERLSVLVVRTSIVCAWAWSRSRSAVLGAAQVSEGLLTTEHIPRLGSMHCMQGGRAYARAWVSHGVMVVLQWLPAWVLHYRSQAVHGWWAWQHDVGSPWRGR